MLIDFTKIFVFVRYPVYQARELYRLLKYIKYIININENILQTQILLYVYIIIYNLNKNR